MNTIKTYTAAIIILLAAIATGSAQNAQTDKFSEELKTITIKVKGITCTSDVERISANIKKLKGVEQCIVVKQGATSKYEVSFDPAIVSEKEIHAAIEKTAGCENPNDNPYKVK